MRRCSRVFTLIVSVVALASVGVVAWMAPAGAGGEQGAAPLTVVKTVSGPVPEGTTFTATIECDESIIVDGDGSSASATVEFDATGQPTTADTVTFGDPGTCTITETEDGGAATTTYACESTEPEEEPEPGLEQVLPEGPICSTAGPQEDPIIVNIIFEDQTATVTIANTFEPAPTTTTTPAPPAASPAIVARPIFTG